MIGLTHFSSIGVRGMHSFLLNFGVVKGSLSSPVFGVWGSHMALSFDVLRNVYFTVWSISGGLSPRNPPSSFDSIAMFRVA